jgi:hypothetical protein
MRTPFFIETVNKLTRENAMGTLVVPEWKSAPFWPIIHTGFKLRAFIKNVKVFKGYNITHHCDDIEISFSTQVS